MAGGEGGDPMLEIIITVAVLDFIIGVCVMLIYILIAIGPEKTNQLSKWLRRKNDDKRQRA